MLKFEDKKYPAPDRDLALFNADHTCRWCSFKCDVGQIAYSSTGGESSGEPSHVACPVCFFCQHIPAEWSEKDREDFMPVWLPEMQQRDLAHVGRAILVLADMGIEHPEMAALRQHLHDREYDLSRFILASGGRDKFDISGVASRMSPPDREAFMDGLRILPRRASVRTITDWLEGEGSLSGMSQNVLERHEWFVEAIGLKLNGFHGDYECAA